jgi:opacity protein-like surface antigen
MKRRDSDNFKPFRNTPAAVIFAAVLLVVGAAGVAAQDVLVTEATGKVEVRPPGSGWRPAVDDMRVPSGSMISTGFNSRAILDLGESTVEVRPLTRMSITELVRRESRVTTELFLDVGRVRAEVRSGEGLRHDFTVRSTVSTASVRGTVLEGDGEEWESEEGTFEVTNRGGRKVTVTGGESTTVSGFGPPSDPKTELDEETEVNSTTNPSGLTVPGSNSGGPNSDTAEVTITWE